MVHGGKGAWNRSIQGGAGALLALWISAAVAMVKNEFFVRCVEVFFPK